MSRVVRLHSWKISSCNPAHVAVSLFLGVAGVKCCHVFLGLCTACQNNSSSPASACGPVIYIREELELCDMKY